jgi:transcriptional regulator with XRE-family HTH domain
VCIVPRKRKFIHPLYAIRDALGISQSKFATMFGVSKSLIQKIELGQGRNVSNDLADAVALLCGFDPESLKRKRGAPVFLIGSGEHRVELWGDSRHVSVSQSAEAKKAVQDFVDLNLGRRHRRAGVHEQHPTGPAWRRKLPRRKVSNQRERLRIQIRFWQLIILPGLKQAQRRVLDVLNNKLGLLTEAAESEDKFYSVAMQLSRWIDDVVRRNRQLRWRIKVIRNSRSGDAAQWPTFMETLSESFRLIKPPRELPRAKTRRHRRRRKC